MNQKILIYFFITNKKFEIKNEHQRFSPYTIKIPKEKYQETKSTTKPISKTSGKKHKKRERKKLHPTFTRVIILIGPRNIPPYFMKSHKPIPR